MAQSIREGIQPPTYSSISKNNAEQRGDGERRAEMAPNVTPVADGKRIKSALSWLRFPLVTE